MISGIAEKLFSPFERGKLFVGFSGGADSTAALLAVLEWRERHPGCTVEAVHFDHHLRGDESAREAAAAHRFAQDRGVPFRKIDLCVADSGEGVEAAARAARLAEWQRLCAGRDDAAVVTGHHADDRVENLLLRLFRGGNVSSLTSLRGRSTVGGVTFLRPLADRSRAEVEAFLRSRGVSSWQTDSSNLGADYARNSWRNELLPKIYSRFPWSASGVRRALTALERDAEFIDDAAERFYRSGDPGAAEFWRSAAPALRPRLLRKFLRDHCGCEIIPPAPALERMEAALATPERTEALLIPVLGGRSLCLADGRLMLAADAPPDAVWDWRAEPVFHWGAWRLERRFERRVDASGVECACFDAAALPGGLTVGAPRPGERMIPFGRERAENLHKLRVDRGVGAYPPLPVLRGESGEVLWACMVRRSAAAPVGDPSGEAVCFRCFPA
jgi:tRNA(Ile)-lysidine synthase